MNPRVGLSKSAKALRLSAVVLCTTALGVTSALAQISVAQAINNRGDIAGGVEVEGGNGFHAFILDKDGFDDLGTFGGFASRADAINDRGEAIGQSDTAIVDSNGEFISLAFLADENGVYNLGALPGFKYSQAFAISNHGTVVGWSYNLDPTDPFRTLPGFQATAWNNGVVSVIGNLGGGSSVAFGINDAGVIVGRSRLANGQNHAFVYDGRGMIDLGTLGGTQSEARAINNRGEIAGQSVLANGQRHAVLWNRGVVTDLGTLGGQHSRSWDINDRGDIVGESTTADGDLHAFLYSNGVLFDLGTLGGSNSVAFGMNNRRDIVGVSETAAGDTHAFVIRGGVMEDLAGMLSGNPDEDDQD